MQLALAALHSANQLYFRLPPNFPIGFSSRIVYILTLNCWDGERGYLRSILSRQSSEHTVSELVEFLNAIDSWARKYKFPSDKDLKHINRKLKSCWGLSSHDESKKRDKKSKHKSKRSSMKCNLYLLILKWVCEGHLVLNTATGV
ncbi:unnamed protein product [Prunus armeniaca]|uniref:Uncharacterized protein n=1 Tax=Prunus armeniaca TaxID=36596 RepID=A0A6J5VRM3_PRUAR|nr:unnamed protein product [Prunus armeniaca]CAB4321291.1 unnamed protein product [Prunus armeniaca]